MSRHREEKVLDCENFAMSRETPALDMDRSSAEEAGEGHRLRGLPLSGLGRAFPSGRGM